ncbi:MAG: RNA polymerase sigma factor [Nannocystales bacterium]
MTEPDPRLRDAKRLQEIAAGEREAFDALHREHYRAVVRLAMGIVGDPDEARDVAQEVFVRLLEVAPRWKPEAKVSTWLHRTTLNVSLTMRRRVVRWWSRSSPYLRRDVDPEQAVALGRAAQDLDGFLRLLSPRQRAVVTLHFDQGFAPAEIAVELEMTPNAARLALSKGLRALRREAGTAVREIVEEEAGT